MTVLTGALCPLGPPAGGAELQVPDHVELLALTEALEVLLDDLGEPRGVVPVRDGHLDLEGAGRGTQHQHLAGVPALDGRALLGRDGSALGPVADELLGVALGPVGGHRAVHGGHLLPLVRRRWGDHAGWTVMPEGTQVPCFRFAAARAGGGSSAATTADAARCAAARRGGARAPGGAARRGGCPRRWNAGRGRGRWRGSRSGGS